MIHLSEPSASTPAQTETSISENQSIETEDDVLALQALALYGRRLPVPQIAKSLGVSRATTYRLINRGKELVGMKAQEAIPKALYLLDDMIRMTLNQLQEVDNREGMSRGSKEGLKISLIRQVCELVNTQLTAAKMVMPTGPQSNVEVSHFDVEVQLIREQPTRTISDIMNEVRKQEEEKYGKKNPKDATEKGAS